jgi:hypothetical protein
MQFISYPSSENLARLIVLPPDMVAGDTDGAFMVDRVPFPGGMDGGRYINFDLTESETNVWVTIPLALFYDYYRLGTMFAGAAPQNLLVNLLLSGTSYAAGGLYAEFKVNAYFVNIGEDVGTLPAGTGFIGGLDIDPLSTGGVFILQKLVMGPIYISPGEADLSDGLLILRISRQLGDIQNTYFSPVYLYSLTIDMASKR